MLDSVLELLALIAWESGTEVGDIGKNLDVVSGKRTALHAFANGACCPCPGPCQCGAHDQPVPDHTGLVKLSF